MGLKWFIIVQIVNIINAGYKHVNIAPKKEEIQANPVRDNTKLVAIVGR